MNMLCKRQRGVALLVALVVLTITLILGVSSYQNSRLEEAMAGNQRASALALMAAEYGASDFWFAVKNGGIPVDDPSDTDTLETYTQKILEALRAWAVDAASGIDVNKCVGVGSGLSNTCYVLSIEPVDGEVVPVVVDGLVYSGDLAGSSFSSSALSTLPDSVVARRRMGMKWGVITGETLSAFNYAGGIYDYSGVRSDATISGEEVNGYVNPAVSVGSYDDALKVVMDIVGASHVDDKKYVDNVVFVPDEDGVGGVFHAKDVVDTTSEPPIYTGDYESCNTASNSMCDYKGGVSVEPGTPILKDPAQFHKFMTSLVTQTGSTGDAATWTSEMANYGEGVTFVTNQSESDGYSAPVYDANLTRDTDDPRLERDFFNIGDGNFLGSGVLVIDGDVEFNGNPKFDGLIIVLGDYNIKGSGGDDTTGAIISAPYSMSYENSSGSVVSPERDGVSGNILDENGVEVPNTSVSGKVVYLTPDPGDADPDAPAADGYPVVVDNDGNIVRVGGVPVRPSLPGAVDTDTDDGDLDIDPVREFQAVGVDVSGGGSQNYIYDYGAIELAFSFFSDDTLLDWLVGQRRSDGTYEFGLSTWSEVVVVQ